MVLYGAGGHAKSVYDCLKSRAMELNGAFDDNPEISTFMGYAVQPYSSDIYRDEQVIISIGANSVRQKLSEVVWHSFGQVMHKTAYTGYGVDIGAGTVVLANSTVQALVKIGDHCIINSASVIEHDCRIGDFVHVGPGAVVCGDAIVEEGVLIGANATILPGRSIGKWSVVGAGAVVTTDVPPNTMVAGVPARIKSN